MGVNRSRLRTGYDEPLLHTRYVDKTLSGIKQYRPGSRLDRAHAKKHDVAEALRHSWALCEPAWCALQRARQIDSPPAKPPGARVRTVDRREADQPDRMEIERDTRRMTG